METTSKPALLLLPNVIGDDLPHQVFLPSSVDKAVASIDGLIAESVKAGRRFLSRFATKKPANDIPLALFNEHTPDADIDFLLEPMLAGQRWGLVSDAGLPCLADPGSKLVWRARQVGIPIQAFVGPSSIFMALMLSGFHGQNFAFNGYLPKESAALQIALTKLQKRSQQEKSTQIFIEAPYRNQQTLELAIHALSDETLFCAAWNLTSQNQGIVSQPVKLWKKSPLPNLDKKTAIFLIQSL
jgi:16S rRNA (cytidine1402-2'-O)-methyltransferase